jgi:DNA-binding response OmpR family regulator
MLNPIALHKAKQSHDQILLVEDNLHLRELTQEILEDAGYQVTTTTCGEAAIKTLYNKDFNLVITDLNMGAANGISVLKKTKELNPATKVIIMTGNTDVRFVIEALRYNANDYILKPFHLGDLLARVYHCIGKPSSLDLQYS